MDNNNDGGFGSGMRSNSREKGIHDNASKETNGVTVHSLDLNPGMSNGDFRSGMIMKSTEKGLQNNSTTNNNVYSQISSNSAINIPPSTKQGTRQSSNAYSLDIQALNSKNREKLLRTFLPDIEQAHARLGYVYKVRPFNYNHEHFKTVTMRHKPAVQDLSLRDSKVVLKGGRKAANEVEPRPTWLIKHVQGGKTVVNPNEEYSLFTRFYPWRNRGMERSVLKGTYSRTNSTTVPLSAAGRSWQRGSQPQFQYSRSKSVGYNGRERALVNDHDDDEGDSFTGLRRSRYLSG